MRFTELRYKANYYNLFVTEQLELRCTYIHTIYVYVIVFNNLLSWLELTHKKKFFNFQKVFKLIIKLKLHKCTF